MPIARATSWLARSRTLRAATITSASAATRRRKPRTGTKSFSAPSEALSVRSPGSCPHASVRGPSDEPQALHRGERAVTPRRDRELQEFKKPSDLVEYATEAGHESPPSAAGPAPT